MLIEGKFILNAHVQTAWEYLLKPETLASCIPGCEKLELVSENVYDCIVVGQVGPISAKFRFSTRLVEIRPPTYFKAIGEGQEMNKAGNFNQETVINLKKVSDKAVEVSYTSNIKIVGRLSTFGDRILKAKAKQVGVQFTEALNKRLAGEEPVTSGKLKIGVGEVFSAYMGTVKDSLKRGKKEQEKK